jgi:hypothetical protein
VPEADFATDPEVDMEQVREVLFDFLLAYGSNLIMYEQFFQALIQSTDPAPNSELNHGQKNGQKSRD